MAAHASVLLMALEDFLSAPEAQRPDARARLLAALRAALADGCWEEAALTLRRALVPTLDYTTAQSLYRVYRQLRPQLPDPGVPLKLALLSNVTSDPLAQFLELFLFANGVAVELYRSDYGLLRQEILDPDSGLYAFRPRILFLATTWRDLSEAPPVSADAATVQARVEAEVAGWAQLWRLAHERLGCQVVQNNFDAPPWRALANHETRHPAGFGRFVAAVNASLADAAPPYVTLHDLDHLASTAGRWAWHEARFFYHAKLPCAPECLVDYAHSAASVIAAHLGLARKCLVLDLDNTLWGGVIGDDGLGGIRLGQGEAEAEAFVAFQHYVKALRQRGVLLAVCSKNEEATARAVFEQHPAMVLRLDDIACFVANWQDKATNLRQIARQLNIGLNSLVFVDDNPAERALVRQLAPEVAVPELPADPSGYIRALECHRFFQTTSLAGEDLRRTEFYRANAAREQAEASATNVAEFLQSLRMVARVEPVHEATLERTAQLIARSNQFNLTTRRYSAAEVLAMARSPHWITRTISLTDRFGDNGLISVLLACIEGDTLRLDTWLMSCRVLKRGVEELLLNHIQALARARGLRRIVGEYIPTAKNAMVREHYARLGFCLIETNGAGHAWWELAVTPDWTPRTTYIREVHGDG
ncbi:MAG: HAD-IIIC family phosphatase [Armatimonadetes bacterium]|nr:HAD-IIIC family phosphatase [Armatimonadota bacterium]